MERRLTHPFASLVAMMAGLFFFATVLEPYLMIFQLFLKLLSADAVPKSVSDADRKRIHQLEGIEGNLRNEVSILKVCL